MLGSLLRRVLRRPGRTTLASAYALYEQGRWDDAERAAGAIADVPPADVLFFRGLIARGRGELTRSAALIQAALAERADPSFHLMLAQVLAGLGRHGESLEHYAQFFDSKPDAASEAAALQGAANCFIEAGDVAQAVERLRRAVALAPEDATARESLAVALWRASRIEEARNAIDSSVAAHIPGARIRRALLLPSVYASEEHIEQVRERFDAELDEILDAPAAALADPVSRVGILPFYLAYHNRNNAGLMAKFCRVARQAYPAAAAHERPRKRRGGPLHVGFVSTAFHSHSVGRTTIGLIRDLPRERFVVHVFAIDPKQDPMRAAIEQAADHYRTLPAVLDDVRLAIERSDLDVLVFADIGMHPLTYFLALWRLAPVQIVTWGHSETSGIDSIDYYWSARGVEIDRAQTHYTERLVQPDAFFMPGYAPPVLERAMSRDELGLPVDAHLYACLQPAFKLHPNIDRVFAAILDRDDKAEILLLDSAATGPLRERFERTLGGATQRVRFLPGMVHQRFLATLAASDVALDPLYFGGCNSSCEAFAAGVPLITLPGDHLYGRFTLGLYREMNIDAWIADSVERYVDLACAVACDTEVREAASREIRERSAVLYERRDITLAYADFLENEAIERLSG